MAYFDDLLPEAPGSPRPTFRTAGLFDDLVSAPPEQRAEAPPEEPGAYSTYVAPVLHRFGEIASAPFKIAGQAVAAGAGLLTKGDPTAYFKLAPGDVTKPPGFLEDVAGEFGVADPTFQGQTPYQLAKAGVQKATRVAAGYGSEAEHWTPEQEAAFRSQNKGLATAETVADIGGELLTQIGIPGTQIGGLDPLIRVLGKAGSLATAGRVAQASLDAGAVLPEMVPILRAAGFEAKIGELATDAIPALEKIADAGRKYGNAERAFGAAFIPGMAAGAVEKLSALPGAISRHGLISPEAAEAGVGGLVDLGFTAFGAKHALHPEVGLPENVRQEADLVRQVEEQRRAQLEQQAAPEVTAPPSDGQPPLPWDEALGPPPPPPATPAFRVPTQAPPDIEAPLGHPFSEVEPGRPAPPLREPTSVGIGPSPFRDLVADVQPEPPQPTPPVQEAPPTAAPEPPPQPIQEPAPVARRPPPGRLKEPTVDERGIRVLPGEEDLPSGERESLDVASTQAVSDVAAAREQERQAVMQMRHRLQAAAGKGRPLSEGVGSVLYEEQTRGRVSPDLERLIEKAIKGNFAGHDYKQGTALEGVEGTPEQLLEALRKDKGNKKELAIRAAVREHLRGGDRQSEEAYNPGDLEEPIPEDADATFDFQAMRRRQQQAGPGLFDQKLEEEPKREEPKPVEEPSPPDRPLPLKSIRRGQAVEGYYHDTPFRGVVSSVESDRSGYPGTERDGRIIVALSRDLTVYGGRRKAGEDSIVIAYSRGEQERDAITRIIPEDPGGEAPRTEPKPAPVTVPREIQQLRSRAIGDGVEVRLWRNPDGKYGVGAWDTEADHMYPGVTLFPSREAAEARFDAAVRDAAEEPSQPPATTIERTPAGQQRTLVSALDTTSRIKPASAFHESPLFNQEREAEARRVERSQASLFGDEEPSLMERKPGDRLSFWRKMADSQDIPEHVREMYRGELPAVEREEASLAKTVDDLTDREAVSRAVREAEDTVGTVADAGRPEQLAAGERAARVGAAQRILDRVESAGTEETKSLSALSRGDRTEARILGKTLDSLRPDSPVFDQINARLEELANKGARRLDAAQTIVDRIGDKADAASEKASRFLDAAETALDNPRGSRQQLANLADQARELIREKEARAAKGYAFKGRPTEEAEATTAAVKARVKEAEAREKVKAPAGLDISSLDDAQDKAAKRLGEVVGRDGARAVKDAARSISARIASVLGKASGKTSEFAGFTMERGVHGYSLGGKVRVNLAAQIEAAVERVGAKRTRSGQNVAREVARSITNVLVHEYAHQAVKEHGKAHTEQKVKIMRALSGEPMVAIRSRIEAALKGKEAGLSEVLGLAKEAWGERNGAESRVPGGRGLGGDRGEPAPGGYRPGAGEERAAGREGVRTGLAEAVPRGEVSEAERVGPGASRGDGRAGVQPELKKQTDTPEFRRWFGDSKVVDDSGDPLVVYHGTTDDFSVFRPGRGGELGTGIYFSDSPDTAAKMGSRNAPKESSSVLAAFLSMRNPLITTDREVARSAGPTKLQKQGYDGIIYTGSTGERQFVVFRPEQIKSATGNRGTFDPENPDIRFMDRPRPQDEEAARRKQVADLALGRSSTKPPGTERIREAPQEVTPSTPATEAKPAPGQPGYERKPIKPIPEKQRPLTEGMLPLDTGTVIRYIPRGGGPTREGVVIHAPKAGRVDVKLDDRPGIVQLPAVDVNAIGHLKDLLNRKVPTMTKQGAIAGLSKATAGQGPVDTTGKPGERTAPFNLNRMSLSPENREMIARVYDASKEAYEDAAQRMTEGDIKAGAEKLLRDIGGRETVEQAIKAGVPLSDPRFVHVARGVLAEYARELSAAGADLREAVRTGKGKAEAERKLLEVSLANANYSLAFRGAQAQAARALAAFKILQTETGPVRQLLRKSMNWSCLLLLSVGTHLVLNLGL